MKERIDNDWYDELLSLTKKISRRKEETTKELSVIDLEKEDILHYIELARYDAVTGWKLLSELKRLLEERRRVKEEIRALQKALDNKLSANYVEKIDNQTRSYVCRTDILKRIIGLKSNKFGSCTFIFRKDNEQ